MFIVKAFLLMQFERTLIVADEDSQVSYLEGCTAPSYDKNQVTFMSQLPQCISMLCHALNTVQWREFFSEKEKKRLCLSA